MLVEFTVENFLSFKDPTTLSFEASTDTSLRGNVVEAAQETKFNLLRATGVYGANASGKSNLLHALLAMQRMVLHSVAKPPTMPIPAAAPYRLDPVVAEQPTTMEVVFLRGGVRYQYGFSVDRTRVVEEWLYASPRGKRRLLFERNPEGAPGEFKFGDSWTGEAQKLVGVTRDDILFLSTAAQFNHPMARDVVAWFGETLTSTAPFPVGQSEEFFTLDRAARDPKLKTRILDLLRKADVGIEDFDVELRPMKEAPRFSGIPRGVLEQMSRLAPAEAGELHVLEARPFHRGAAPKGKKASRVPFDMNEESTGTYKLFALAGPLLHVLDHGCVLVADELDIGLHPLLTRAVVALFHDPTVNTSGAQLLFATHDVNLLDDHELFRRDQVWLAEKAEDGSSSVRSLWDYKPRKGENLRKGYLAGRYGGVPLVESLVGSARESR